MVKQETVLVNLQTLNGFVEKEYTIIIGQNAKENTQIIKDSHPENIWFHLSSSSSAHIILQNEGDIIPKRYLNQIAGKLFKYKKNAPIQDVIYTEIKNVKLTSTPGLVLPSNLKIIQFNLY
jgi:predicted ribosome quality control (RQC) complex YloA/Tae2 family protein